MMEDSLDSENFVSSALVDIYVKSGNLNIGHHVLYKMSQRDLV